MHVVRMYSIEYVKKLLEQNPELEQGLRLMGMTLEDYVNALNRNYYKVILTDSTAPSD